jgi:hypothetical protein
MGADSTARILGQFLTLGVEKSVTLRLEFMPALTLGGVDVA